MASTPRRPVNARDAAEAFFAKPAPKAEPAPARVAVPGARESVTLKLDQAVVEHFQNDGPGWQDRINDVLRAYVEGRA